MKTMKQQLMELATMHLDCELWACDDGCEVHIINYNGICVKSYSWYCTEIEVDDGEDYGEYKDSIYGIGEDKEDILMAYAENHESVELIRPKLYEEHKQLLLDALKNAHKAYWLWRLNFVTQSDIDFKELTDIAVAIDNFVDEREV